MHVISILKRNFKRFLGFSIIGVIVTLISMSLTYFFLGIIRTPLYITYISIYIFTIFLSYILNSRIIFKSGKSIKKMIQYYGVYLAGMLLGVFVLRFYKDILPFENYILSYLVIPITLTWNYSMSTLVFKKK